MEKHYNFLQSELEMQELWERDKTYMFDKNAMGEIYSIDTPPPTVSGSLHIGHLFSYTQAEIIARFRRMQGYNVFYPFGFDDNGLPTERLVEREENIRANVLQRSEFIGKCKNTTEKYEIEFKKLWKMLGISVDWSTEYHTIDSEVCKISQKKFLELAKLGKAYVKDSPVLWCTECQSSIAQAELETEDIKTGFIYISFIIDGVSLQVATTRPELLYGCVCLFVNPSDERYLKFIGKTAVVPLYNYEVPILSDDKVDINKGTGIVMCATFGDITDTEWYLKHKLLYRKVILANGNIAEDVPFIAGLTVKAARNEIVRLLRENGLLIKEENLVHAVAVHERCGTEIEIIPSRQWYIDILSDKEKYLKAADKINWYPAQMKNRYIAWVENVKWDWCISRQRYFGVPFPIWYCKNCSKPMYASEEQIPVNPLETQYEGLCDCGCKEFIPESAVFDTWVTSSLTPQINERLGLKLTPMSMRTHAHEIIRTWTFYTIVRSLYHTGEIPWKNLMICGFVLAKKGEKIGKSKNNSEFDPKHLITTHSADVLRYWTAGAKLGTDTFFSSHELTVVKRFITKLWNASRFAVSHLEDIDFNETPPLMPIDRWLIERTNQVVINAAELLCEYEIGSARRQIDEFFWKDICDNYIEIVKDRLYKPDVYGIHQRRSGQFALYYAFLNALKLYSIYVPHISEYIYQGFFRKYENKTSIHRTLWVTPTGVDYNYLRFGEKIKEVVSETRKYKSERNLSMRAEMNLLIIKAEPAIMDWIKETAKDIKACTNADRIDFILE